MDGGLVSISAPNQAHYKKLFQLVSGWLATLFTKHTTSKLCHQFSTVKHYMHLFHFVVAFQRGTKLTCSHIQGTF